MTLREFIFKLKYSDLYIYVHKDDGTYESNRYARIKYMNHIIKYISIDQDGYHFFIYNTTTETFNRNIFFEDIVKLLDESIIIKINPKFYYYPNLEIEQLILKNMTLTIK